MIAGTFPELSSGVFYHTTLFSGNVSPSTRLPSARANLIWTGKNPGGRNGNHRMQGFLLAPGKDIKSGTIKGARTVAVAPTILIQLGRPAPPETEERALFRPRQS